MWNVEAGFSDSLMTLNSTLIHPMESSRFDRRLASAIQILVQIVGVLSFFGAS
jgi:hypothetical protein